MLSQIVGPLVDTQIKRLANSQATYSTLIETIAKWLSYLGVKAKVTHLTHKSGQIQVSLIVDKPHNCGADDWQKILHNLDRQQSIASLNGNPTLPPSQRSKLQRLFAYLIQISQLENQNNPRLLSKLLNHLELDELMILGIRSALKVPQTQDRLLKELDPDIVARAIPQAMKIVLSAQKFNPEVETAIITILKVAKSSRYYNTRKMAQQRS